MAPTIRIEYCLNRDHPVARTLDWLNSLRRVFNIPGSAFLIRKLARAAGQHGPVRWRALCGDTQSQVESFLRSYRPDVVYCSFPFEVGPPSTSRPLVTTIYDLIFERFYNRKMGEETRRWLEACYKVPVLSQATFDELRDSYPAYVQKALVIRHGIPSSCRIPTEGEAQAFRLRMGLPEKFLLLTGWFTSHKNQQVVFEAVAKLRERGLPIPVVCTGPNSKWLNEPAVPAANRDGANFYTSQVVEFCQAAGLRNGIDYFSLGFVDDFDVACLYRSATMLIVPSLAEGSSLPALEAMVARCPVVLSDIPPLREIMELTGNNSWSFPASDSSALADVVAEVIGNPEEVRRRTMAAAEAAPRAYSWGKVAREYFSLFEEAAGLGQSRSPDRQPAPDLVTKSKND